MVDFNKILCSAALVGALVLAACGDSATSPAATGASPAAATRQTTSPTIEPTPVPTATTVSSPTPMPTPVPNGTTFPSPTPVPNGVPLTANEILASSRERLEAVKSLLLEMEGSIEGDDKSFSFKLKGEMELPDRAHGTFQMMGNPTAFLRVNGENYAAYSWENYKNFERDEYFMSGGAFLEILKPLLTPEAEEPFVDLERYPDEMGGGEEYYHIGFRLDMLEFIQHLEGGSSPGVEIKGQGELLIDRTGLLPYQFIVTCLDCKEAIDYGLTMEYTLKGFNEPVSIPDPKDRPVLLPVTEPDDHGDTAEAALQSRVAKFRGHVSQEFHHIIPLLKGTLPLQGPGCAT